MSEKELRKSKRSTKGIPPVRYEQNSCRQVNVSERQNHNDVSEDPKQIAVNPTAEKASSCKTASKTSKTKTSAKSLEKTQISNSRKTKSSIIKRKQLELELEKDRRLAEIEKRLIEKEMALKKAEIEEMYSSRCSTLEIEDDAKTATSKSSYVQRWINNLEPQNQANVSSPGEDSKMKQFMARQSINKELPPFSGEPGEWINFITQFKESTEICGFSSSENINRLQKSLRGKARESVNALLTFTQDVNKILDILEKQFGRPEIIIHELIDSLTKIPPLKEDRMDVILSFANKIQNLAITVENLNCKEYLLNPQLLSDLTKKLTFSMKMEWGRKIVELKKLNKPVNILELSAWLQETGEAAMYVTSFDIDIDKKKKFVCTASVENDKIVHKCKMCKKDGHKLEKCHEFKKFDCQKRWEWVRKSKICFGCLGSSHQTRQCRSKKRCNINGCTFKHHPLLHKDQVDSEDDRRPPMPETERTELNLYIEADKNEVFLRIAPVEINGPKGTQKIYALFDEGSTVTMIDASVAEEVGVSGPKEPLKIRWTNSITNEDLNSMTVSFKIRGQNDFGTDSYFILNNVKTIQNLDLPVQSIDIKKMRNKWNYLNQIGLSSMENVKPKILIGHDNIDLIIPREVHDGGKNTPILSKSKLGWVVHGSIDRSKLNRINEDFVLFVRHEYDNLEKMIKDSFKIDSLGVKYCEKLHNPDETRALEILNKTTKRISQNRWESGLLWKKDDLNLPENRITAVSRLHSIEKKMDRNSTFSEEYTKKISEYMEKGYARKVPSEDKLRIPKNLWYLPHFAVTNPNKPGKLRLVMDAAAKTKGISLNDVLLKGPDLLNSLLGVVFKFRQRAIGFTADIQEMFHQVYIRWEDRSAQRFLWRGEDRSQEPEEYEMIAMTFGAASSPTTAQYVMRKNAQEFKESFPDAERAIREQHYVDDYLDSKDTVEEAKEIVREVIEVHGRGGFIIRNWSSNSKELLKSIPEKYINNKIKDMTFEKNETLPTERVLGLYWNPNSDAYEFSTKWNNEEIFTLKETKSVTKREALRIVMTIFDPFGFLSNFVIKGRIILQDVWRSKLDWDNNLNDDLMKRWRRWVNEIENIPRLTIPRAYVPNISQAKNTQLHVFCDASTQAYSAVAYFRFEFSNETKTAFVMAKSRVTPLKPTTIPRMELAAALLGSRLAVTIKENHSIEVQECYFWSDSQIVISWIKSDAALFKPFVAHRVTEIKESSREEYWNWVPTQQNVADEATREEGSIQWNPNSRWFIGPDFLKLHKEHWPKHTFTCSDTSEVRKKFVGFVTKNCSSLPEVTRFSSWLKLIRSTAWCLRFINKALNKNCPREELIPEELHKAEKYWIKQTQKETFFEEIKRLESNKLLEKSSKLFILSPILDKEGILRLKGRTILSMDLSEDAKYPIILPPKHNYTKLLINHYHRRALHHGQEYVINELRQKYWILNMRSAVRSSWNNCQWCKNKRAKPDIPEMSPLPSCRLSSFVRPFTIVGMDYFGPMYVAIGRRREKRYGVLFTCMSVRAIHIEIASSLNTDAAIMSILRMTGRRGWPMKIYSDNGTNLKGAEKEIKEALRELNQDQMITALAKNDIQWFFNCPQAPHHGGSWERLIRSVKTSLNVILKERTPREETLQTLLIEVEHIVNSRPLVHVSLDHADDTALTPNHFLLGSSSGIPILLKFDEKNIVSRKQWKISQTLSDHFWRRWVREYLPVLTKRTKWFSSSGREFQINDVVIIMDSEFSKNSWPKGVITQVYPGSDGRIRVADIKTLTGTYKRPVTKLCLLDVKKE